MRGALISKPWPVVPLVRLAAICLLITSLIHCQGGNNLSKGEGKAPAITVSEEKLRRELERAAHKLIAIIEKGDPKELLSLCSRAGVAFGIDWPEISLEEIRKDIEKKEDIYCVLFDTECLRKWHDELRRKYGAPARTEPLYSYRELFAKASSREVKVFVLREPTLGGQVSVYLKGGPAEEDPENPKYFGFAYEDGKWKLTAVPYH